MGLHPMGQGMDGRGPFADRFQNWEREDVKDLVEMVRTIRMAKALGLDDEQTVLLIRRLEEQRQTKDDLIKRRDESLAALRELVKSKADDQKIEEALAVQAAIDRETIEARASAAEKLGQGLSATQRAKVYLFLQDFEHDMRGMIDRARQFRHGHDNEGPGQGMRDRQGEGPGQGMRDRQGEGPGQGMRGRQNEGPALREGAPGPAQGNQGRAAGERNRRRWNQEGDPAVPVAPPTAVAE